MSATRPDLALSEGREDARDTAVPDLAIRAPPHSSTATGSQPREGRSRSASPASSISHLSPTTQTRFDLPNLPAARQSASSLMDAIFGGPAPPGPSAGHDAPALLRSSPAGPTQPSISPTRAAPPPAPTVQFKRKPKKSVSRTPSSRSHQSNADTESWDVLSDADSRLNEEAGEGERDEVVAELQKKVDRRKSQLPQLETELAQLEAQIKAAEERLARVQVAQNAEGGRT